MGRGVDRPRQPGRHGFDVGVCDRVIGGNLADPEGHARFLDTTVDLRPVRPQVEGGMHIHQY